ncbi:hypothetical protein CEQ90_04060 [Lewinellaceae bacterium SD302]|nr:hypothetical protein CEQ90_04060 [Lewinellaceae bacterium SD302]
MTVNRFSPVLLSFLTAIFLSSVATPEPVEIQRFTMDFFAQPINIEYAPTMRVDRSVRELDERVINQIYGDLKRRPTHILLKSLLANKEIYALNDFLFYKLARQSMAVIYNGKESALREISLFHLLNEAGFDARLTFKGKRAYVNIFTQDDLFEVPIIESDGRSYANISCMNGECNGRQRLYIFQNQPNPSGRSFGFKLNDWPRLKIQPVKKPLRFNFRNATVNMNVTYDKTMVDIMEDYPFIHEYAYLETPLSPTLRESLLPELRRMLGPLSEREQLEFLVSFTRSAFAYKEDNAYFGRSKPMVPEELFSYDYSDCEDRSALFFALVKDLMGKSMAVVAYDDHLTVAVESDDIPGDFFNYEGRRYIFCDPTGPKGSSRIGQIPPGYEDKSFEIIGQHK